MIQPGERFASSDRPNTPRDSSTAAHELDVGGFGWLTSLGLAVAAIGWALLIASMVGLDAVARSGKTTLPSHGDLVDVAMCLVGSGFGLAILGGLHNGFGVLNRFFMAVLTRSAQRSSPPEPAAPDVVPPEPESFEDRDLGLDRDAESLRERRPYRILEDGSVEVDTIVGSRRFTSMHEARDFI